MIRFPWQRYPWLICEAAVIERGPEGQTLYVPALAKRLTFSRAALAYDLPDSGFVSVQVDVQRREVLSLWLYCMNEDATS